MIATVRPATILADVAVAVHPDDERYGDAIGREVVVPFVERRVTVIADERVDPSFGTGALKVTPGPRPDRLPDRAGAPSARAHGDRPGRAYERRGWFARGTLPSRGGRSGRRLGARTEGCSSSASTTATPSAPASAATRGSSRSSRSSGGAGWQSPRRLRIDCARRAARALPPRVAAPLRHCLPRGRARLVPLAPALVGAPASVWYTPEGEAICAPSEERGAGEGRSGRRARARPRRPRHVVLLGPLAVRHARVARSDGPSSSATTRAMSTRLRVRSSASGRTG